MGGGMRVWTKRVLSLEGKVCWIWEWQAGGCRPPPDSRADTAQPPPPLPCLSARPSQRDFAKTAFVWGNMGPIYLVASRNLINWLSTSPLSVRLAEWHKVFPSRHFDDKALARLFIFGNYRSMIVWQWNVVNACNRAGEIMLVCYKNVSNELFGVRRPIKRIVLWVSTVWHTSLRRNIALY